MLKTLFRGGRILAVSFCAMIFASCGITPLYSPPVDDKSPEEMFDAEVSASLLKAGILRSENGEITVSFSEYKNSFKADTSPKKGFDESLVRAILTIVDNDDKEKGPIETWLPLVLSPFRRGDSLFFFLSLDHVYIMEKDKLYPQFVFMMRPYSYILKAEPESGGWKVGFVQFATTGLEIKKVAEQAQIDKDGTVMNPPAEVLEMLNDPKNYEIVSIMTFLPIKSGK
jgi:hypothetical protein